MSDFSEIGLYHRLSSNRLCIAMRATRVGGLRRIAYYFVLRRVTLSPTVRCSSMYRRLSRIPSRCGLRRF